MGLKTIFGETLKAYQEAYSVVLKKRKIDIIIEYLNDKPLHLGICNYTLTIYKINVYSLLINNFGLSGRDMYLCLTPRQIQLNDMYSDKVKKELILQSLEERIDFLQKIVKSYEAKN